MKNLLRFFVVFSISSISSMAFAQDEKSSAVRPASAASALPNGASSLTETYGLWSINCAVQEGKKICLMHRREFSDQNRLTWAMDVTLGADGGVSGTLAVPFGVLVSKPIRLQVDEGKAVIQTNIRTCMPSIGCIAPVVFDKNFVANLRAGKQLKLAMTAAAPGEPPLNDLFIQLDGFSNALNRLTDLQK